MLFQRAELHRSTVVLPPQINFSFTPIRVLTVTLEHIDHVGRIRYLLAIGINSPHCTTSAFVTLFLLVSEDAIKVGVTRAEELIYTFLIKYVVG